MTYTITGAVDAHVAALEEERQPDGLWHPSSMFGCERKAVYSFLGTPKAALDARTKRVFRIGHIFHEFFQAAMARAVEYDRIRAFFDEVKIVDPVRGIKGHADGLTLELDGTWTLEEIKSIRSNGMKYGDLPKDDHRKQTTAYMTVLRQIGGLWKLDSADKLDRSMAVGWARERMDGELYAVIPPLPGLERVRFIYASKDDLEIREFVQKHTADKEAWFDRYLDRLKAHVANQTLPKRLPNKLLPSGNISPTQHDYRCGYCDYADQCWNVDQEGIE